MGWAPLHPRELMAIALTTLAFLLLMMLLAAPELGSVDLPSLTSSAPAAPDEVAPAAGDPAWLTDPMGAPLADLASAR